MAQLCYESGVGCEENVEKSVELYRVAAAGGFPQAQCNLGKGGGGERENE